MLKAFLILFGFSLFFTPPSCADEDEILTKILEAKKNGKIYSWEAFEISKHIIDNNDKRFIAELNALTLQLEEKSPDEMKDYWPLYIVQFLQDKDIDFKSLLSKISSADPYCIEEIYGALIQAQITKQLEKLKKQSFKFQIANQVDISQKANISLESFSQSQLEAIQYYSSFIQPPTPIETSESRDYTSFISNRKKFYQLIESFILQNDSDFNLQTNFKNYGWGGACGNGSSGFFSCKSSALTSLSLKNSSKETAILELLLYSYWSPLSNLTEQKIQNLCIDILQQQNIDLVKLLTGLQLMNVTSEKLDYIQFLKPEIANQILLTLASINPEKNNGFNNLKTNIWKIINQSFFQIKDENKKTTRRVRSRRSRNSLDQFRLQISQTEKESWLKLAKKMSSLEHKKEILECITNIYTQSTPTDAKEFFQNMLGSNHYFAKSIATAHLLKMGEKVDEKVLQPFKCKITINSIPLANQNIEYKVVYKNTSRTSSKKTDDQGVLVFERESLHFDTGKIELLELYRTEEKSYKHNDASKAGFTDNMPNTTNKPITFFYQNINDPANIYETVELNFLAYPLFIHLDTSEIPSLTKEKVHVSLKFIKNPSNLYDRTTILDGPISFLNDFLLAELTPGSYELTFTAPGAALYKTTFEMITGANLNIKLQKGYTVSYQLVQPIDDKRFYKRPSLKSKSLDSFEHFNYQTESFDHLPAGEYTLSFTEDYPSERNKDRILYHAYQKDITINAESPEVIDLGAIELKQK